MAAYIDVIIPAVIGLILLIWPQSMFYGSRATPDEKKLRLLRGAGGLLLLIAALFLALKLVP